MISSRNKWLNSLPGRIRQARRWRCTSGIFLALLSGMSALPELAHAQPQQHCQATGLSNEDVVYSATEFEKMLNFRSAWSLSMGSGVTVAVIDTGISAHSRLGEVIDGADLTDGGGALVDCDAHGTFVAGIIAGTAGKDLFAGVAPGARLLSIKQTADGHGDLYSLAEAINIALDRGSRVINISLTSCSSPEHLPPGVNEVVSAVERAEREGAVVIAAAGNNSDTCQEGAIAWPAVLPQVVAVGAVQTSEDGQFAPTAYSLTGQWIDISAPGGPVLGPDPNDAEALADLHVTESASGPGTVRPIAGTSFAAPAVSGTAALIISREPWLSAFAVREKIISSATPIDSTLEIGHSVLNPAAALSWDAADLTAQSSREVSPVPSASPSADSEPESRTAGLLLLLTSGMCLWLLLRASSRRSSPQTDGPK